MRAIITALALASAVLASLAIPTAARAQTASVQVGPSAGPVMRPQFVGRIGILRGDKGVRLSGDSISESTDGDFCSVKAFGAIGDATTDDTAAIQRALNATQCGIIFFPAGAYRVSAALEIARDSVIQGTGKQRTVILTSNPSADVLSMRGPGTIGVNSGRLTVRDLTIRTTPGLTKTAGVGIRVAGGSAQDYQGTLIENVEMYDMPVGIELSGGRFNVQNSQIWFSNTGIYVHNDFNQDAGNNTITNTFVFAGTRRPFPGSEGCDTGNIGILITGSNDVKVAHNWIGGGDYGVLIDAQTGADLADMKVLGNAVEGQCIVAIAVNARSQRVLFTVIAHNEITSWGHGILLTGGQPTVHSQQVIINGNIVLFNASGGVLTQAFTGVSVGPHYEGVSLTGNVVAGGANRGDVGYDVQANNGVVITTPIIYAPVAFSSANQALVQGGSYPFALLPAHVADGSYGSCLDCTSGGPCSGGGSGALALKTSTGWVCK
jgi:hypothetical protein